MINDGVTALTPEGAAVLVATVVLQFTLASNAFLTDEAKASYFINARMDSRMPIHAD